jgi:hypothetical protein
VDAKNPLYRTNLTFDYDRCQILSDKFPTTSKQLIGRLNSAGPGRVAGIIYDFSNSQRAEEIGIGDYSPGFNLANGEILINVVYEAEQSTF